MVTKKFEWLDKDEYPFKPHYFPINGHQLHYIDEGQGEIILFVHGTPSWSFDFRHQIAALSKTHRCIAIDHIGFGLSDKPNQYDYSTLNHSKTLEAFLKHMDLGKITLVVHDFGGPIGLHYAIKHPETIGRIVILNSWLWSAKEDPDYIKLSKVLKNPILPFLYKYLNFSPRFLIPKSFGDKKVTKASLKQYTKPFANKDERNGALAFAQSLLNDQSWFEELWTKRSSISQKPTLFIWGMKDITIKPKYLEKFTSGFPNSKTHKLDTCGHFPQEEESMLVTQYLKAFLRDDL